MRKERTPKILAIASGGGHWIQLLRLRPAFAGARVSYASVGVDAEAAVSGCPYFTFPDANRDRKFALIAQIMKIAWIVLMMATASTFWVRGAAYVWTCHCSHITVKTAQRQIVRSFTPA